MPDHDPASRRPGGGVFTASGEDGGGKAPRFPIKPGMTNKNNVMLDPDPASIRYRRKRRRRRFFFRNDTERPEKLFEMYTKMTAKVAV